ncbi:hypothetical protein EV379_0914 [Microterricola gilva]|uniref:Peptidase S74 domain-containing protein n=1 Tax=Microterricola gilva TaxID=393267 RepID=A0A4Q8AKP4_9MICO|nr:hypothetical protein [Microterricola gilva]RZU64611.1 hypothetical protein EV379_0914 [Microterricola gilva]
MANGDAAAAAGMDVVPGASDRRQGYDEINKTRDYIADRTSAVTPIAKGGTGAITAAAARTALDVPKKGDVPTSAAFTSLSNAVGTKVGKLGNDIIELDWDVDGLIMLINGFTQGKIVTTGRPQGFYRNGEALNTGGNGLASPGARGQTITTNYASIYADGSGVFGIPGSTRAMKKDLTEWSHEDAARFLELVSAYHGRYLTDFDDSPIRPFMIVDEFEDAGFEQFVVYDADGIGQGLHYELVTVALLAVAKLHAAQLADIDGRVTALEGISAAGGDHELG